jgi:hypothetical protein
MISTISNLKWYSERRYKKAEALQTSKKDEKKREDEQQPGAHRKKGVSKV